MDVNKPEMLERGMYRFAVNVDRPEITQDNDVDTPFEIAAPQGIPQHLQDLIQSKSVDPEPEVIEQVEGPRIDVEKVTEENPQSRFRILDVALKKPGVCALCASSGGDGRQFVDFGKSVEWYGVVYFCTFCVNEAAKLLGMIDGKKYSQLEEVFNSEWEAKRALVADFKEQLNASRLLLRNCRCGDGDSSDSGPDSVSLDETATEPANKTLVDSDESSDVEGSSDLSKSPVDDDAKSEPERKPRTRRGNSSPG